MISNYYIPFVQYLHVDCRHLDARRYETRSSGYMYNRRRNVQNTKIIITSKNRRSLIGEGECASALRYYCYDNIRVGGNNKSGRGISASGIS